MLREDGLGGDLVVNGEGGKTRPPRTSVRSRRRGPCRTAATAEETYYTDNQAYLAATGQTPKFSTGNTIKVAVTATGYCIQGQNASSDTSTTLYFWYDSTYGGLQTGLPTAASPSVGQTNATCAAGMTYTAVT